ncbi:hypothetical protein [Microbacterium sp.]|uniref:hypothetical protein n=1 Tax=Microbacterium sp. TaxID=51671 RepID=UPI003F9B8752
MTELRDTIATAHGVSDEDRDLLMTGIDEDTLTMQAERLNPPQDLSQGNIARREGQTVQRGHDEDEDMRGFTREMFGNTDDLE